MSSTLSGSATSFRTRIPWIAFPLASTWKLCSRTWLRWSLKLFESWWLEDEVLYFVNPLIYRVEINPIATVLGFQGTLSGIAIEVDGHEDRHWDDVLQVLNGSTIPAVRFLRRFGRPTSAAWCPTTGRGCPTCGSVRMLGYIDGTGWTFLEPGA